MKSLQLSTVWSDEAMLKRVFSWLSRIGAGPKFGSRPIGWYQQHQCACIDILNALGADKANGLRCFQGIVQIQKWNKWLSIISARDLYNQADNKCRS